jgi:hypothetical protein
MIGARFPLELIARVDAWAAKVDGGIPRADAIRRLVELGLKSKGKPWRCSSRLLTMWLSGCRRKRKRPKVIHN